MNITSLLGAQATDRPDAVAIMESHRGVNRTVTFAQLDRLSAQAAGCLHSSATAN